MKKRIVNPDQTQAMCIISNGTCLNSGDSVDSLPEDQIKDLMERGLVIEIDNEPIKPKVDPAPPVKVSHLPEVVAVVPEPAKVVAPKVAGGQK